jgi:hypothetical protein
MDLHLPLILNEIRRGRVLISYLGRQGIYRGPLKRVPEPDWWSLFVQCLEAAETQRFLFDSGQDNTPEEISAFEDTASELVAADLFHLPNWVVWIEDYFSHKTNRRYHYLLI